MNWNYRIIKHVHVLPQGRNWYEFTIHEVYYEKDGSINSWDPKPAEPFGETKKELVSSLEAMKKALKLKMLKKEDMPGDKDE